MLPYSGERSFSFKASDWLARAGQCASVLRTMSLKNGLRYVLLNPLLPPLGSTTHVPTITVAHKLMDNVALILIQIFHSCPRPYFFLSFSTLKVTYIKTSKPNLCKEKKFVYGLKIANEFSLLLPITMEPFCFFFFVNCVSI